MTTRESEMFSRHVLERLQGHQVNNWRGGGRGERERERERQRERGRERERERELKIIGEKAFHLAYAAYLGPLVYPQLALL